MTDTPGHSIAELLREAEQRLSGFVPAPRREARLLLRAATGLGDAQLFASPERAIPADQCRHFQALLNRRRRHEPVAYLLGEREFWSLGLKVTGDTLIPRPETELLVSTCLERLPAAPLRGLDLGTGSGAIALALSSERPQWRFTAVDRSEAALQVARENARRLELTVEFLAGDWFQPVRGRRFELIVANPPYVAEADPHLQHGDAGFEPREALAAGPDGLDDIRRILADCGDFLAPGGWLMLEHGFDQGAAVRHLMQTAGLDQVESRRDLAGHERISLGHHPDTAP